VRGRYIRHTAACLFGMAALLITADAALARAIRPEWSVIDRIAPVPQQTALEPGSGALLVPGAREGITRIARGGHRMHISLPTPVDSISAPRRGDIWAAGNTAVYHRSRLGIRAFPLPRGVQASAPILVSAGGRAVWMAGLRDGQYILARLVAGHWDVVRTVGWVSGLDTVSDREAWAATGDGVLRWNGRRWARVPGTEGNTYTAVRAFDNGITWAVGSGRSATDGIGGYIDRHGYHTAGRGLLTPPAGISGCAEDVWATGQASSQAAQLFPPLWSPTYMPTVSQLLQVRGDGSLLATRMTSTGAPRLLELRPMQVSDSGFPQPTARVRQGAQMAWHVARGATEKHSVGTIAAFHLLNPFPYAHGRVFFGSFPAAGTYPLRDRTDGARARVRVPLRVTSTGQLQLSTYLFPPQGQGYQVQIGVGAGSPFRPWMSTTSGRVPLPVTPGTYEFRSRYADLPSGKHTGWSPVLTVTVD